MKTKRLILALTTWTVVIVMSLHSCQTDSGYDNVIQENNLTEADLFVASEAYKNLEKEIKKNLRRRKNAIDKFSKEEKKQYQQLRKKLSKSDTRVEAQVQLNILLGYDEEASYDRIDSLVWKVYKGTNFTRLELIRARQKRQMNQITISTRDTDSEQRCIDDCNTNATDADMECQHTYYAEVQNAENSMSDWEKLMYPERLEYLKQLARNSRDECVRQVDKDREDCVKDCCKKTT